MKYTVRFEKHSKGINYAVDFESDDMSREDVLNEAKKLLEEAGKIAYEFETSGGEQTNGI